MRRHLNKLMPGTHQSLLLALVIGLMLLLLLQPSDKDESDASLLSYPSQSSSIAATTTAQPPLAPSLTQAPAAEAEKAEDKRLFLTVQPGDNLSLIFKRAGLGAADVYEITNSSDEAAILTKLYPGETLAFDLDQDKSLNALELFKTPLESFHFTKSATSSFNFSKVTRSPQIELVYKDAVIDDSLFLAAQKGGIPASMSLELASIFNGVIDFILDTRKGDSFNILFEKEYLDGEFIGNGRILAATFTNQGISYTALRYEDEAGDSNFFNPNGESMRKAFLRNPVDFTRISSNFSLSRKHPILNTIRAHKGTDYAAPTGTPVVATGDGRVTYASRNGSYGKLVVLQHGSSFETKYAHLNDYAKGISKGSRVKQGQVIGYVGSTGSATGPHLHYEFLLNGTHRNSRTIHDSLPKAESIPASEMERFAQQTKILESLLNNRGAMLQGALSSNATQ